MRRALSGSTAIVLLSAGSASAQSTVPADSAQNADAAESLASDNGLGQIVVTAQRKSESLQKAAIPIDVVSGNALVDSGLSAAGQFSRLVPSLAIQNNGGANSTLFLRGVGNFTVNGYSDPAIAFNYDGVYLGRPTSTSRQASNELSSPTWSREN